MECVCEFVMLRGGPSFVFLADVKINAQINKGHIHTESEEKAEFSF